MNSPGYFELQCDDVKRAASFYETVFGWKLTRQESAPIEYYDVQTDGIRGGLLPRPVPAPPQSGTNAAVVSMEVENFDATAELILKEGGIEALPKFAVPGRCWQGYFIDTESNTFGIFEVDPSAA